MRTAFVKTLTALAAKDERIWLLCGDLGYSVLEEFKDKFASRFLNVGVAEQNMAGIAAGLAMTGKIVFVYSIANFPIMRCFEQIRNDICYHNLNVKIVSVGGGYTYGSAGYSHHGIEDIALMRILPHMAIIAPGDPIETELAIKKIIEYPGPCYLRLGRAGEPIIHQNIPHLEIGKAIKVKEGKDLTVISTGGMLYTALKASEKLLLEGYSIELLSMHSLKPFDREAIIESAKSNKKIVTIEEHGLGGLATIVSEVLVEENIPLHNFIPIKLKQNDIMSRAGSQEQIKLIQKLDINNICKTIVSSLGH